MLRFPASTVRIPPQGPATFPGLTTTYINKVMSTGPLALWTLGGLMLVGGDHAPDTEIVTIPRRGKKDQPPANLSDSDLADELSKDGE